MNECKPLAEPVRVSFCFDRRLPVSLEIQTPARTMEYAMTAEDAAGIARMLHSAAVYSTQGQERGGWPNTPGPHYVLEADDWDGDLSVELFPLHLEATA